MNKVEGLTNEVRGLWHEFTSVPIAGGTLASGTLRQALKLRKELKGGAISRKIHRTSRIILESYVDDVILESRAHLRIHNAQTSPISNRYYLMTGESID